MGGHDPGLSPPLRLTCGPCSPVCCRRQGSEPAVDRSLEQGCAQPWATEPWATEPCATEQSSEQAGLWPDLWLPDPFTAPGSPGMAAGRQRPGGCTWGCGRRHWGWQHGPNHPSPSVVLAYGGKKAGGSLRLTSYQWRERLLALGAQLKPQGCISLSLRGHMSIPRLITVPGTCRLSLQTQAGVAVEAGPP